MLTGGLYSGRKKILLFLYIVFFVPIGILVLFSIDDLADISQKIRLFIGMVYAVICTIGWALFSTALDISGVAGEFDVIKNDIALKKIVSPEQFATRTVTLLCDYFNFSFFTIQYAFAQIIGTECIFSDSVLRKSMDASVLEEIKRSAQESEDVFYMSAYDINQNKCHLYVIPIWFAGEHLGCIGVFTPNKLINLFVRFLSQIETLYIDDQLFHVLNK